MMKHNKIFWRAGQEITPETFIQADDYICRQQNLIRRLIARQYYGLLPRNDGGSSLSIIASLNNREVHVEELICTGITGAGYLIEIDNDVLASVRNKRLLVPESSSKDYYVVLRIHPFKQTLIEPVEDEATPLSHPLYEFDVKSLDNIEDGELSILKIDNGNQPPKLDADYIPPCMSINSCRKLPEIYGQIKQITSEIQARVNLKKEQFRELIYPLRMLYFELDEFPLSEPPVSLIYLIKKIIKTLIFFIPDIRHVKEPDLSAEYNHNDMADIFKSLVKYLHEIQLILSTEEEVEDLTPQI